MLRESNKMKTKIIDRTLPEIYKDNGKMSRLDIIDICWLLKGIGVDIIEINHSILSKIGKLPAGLDFFLRVENIKDIYKLGNSIKGFIFRKDMLSSVQSAQIISKEQPNLILEVRTNSIDGIYRLENLRNNAYFDFISCIRIYGLEMITSGNWVEAVMHIANKLRKNIDICPVDRFHMGTAIALEAAEASVDFITASFAGFGRYTPLEELILAIKVKRIKEIDADLTILPLLCKSFMKHTHTKIAGNKAVIGNEIFRYESGIHACGINNNPETYEPYDPSIVGQERELAIGKHSGGLSIRKKLRELGIDDDNCDMAYLLSSIRDVSIKRGRGLSDKEFVEFFSTLNGSL